MPATRRNFLKKALTATAVTAWTARSWSQVAGANEAVRVGVVGFNGQGRTHLENLRKIPGVRIVALCDADSTVLQREANEAQKRNETVQTYTDVRELLANKDVDAITTATPNHWHALVTVWACQAGKDVYVEKPVSHNVWEGRQMVNAARKFGRIVQTGTQSRSSDAIQQAIAFLKTGQLGRITMARGLCYKRRTTIGRANGPQPIPASVDYDLWCGPAPKSPLTRYRLHYDWHWVWETGSGDLGNQGIHQMDVARWALGYESLPGKVASLGGRYGYADDGQTPNTQLAMYYYEPAPIIFEVRGLPEETGAKEMPKFANADIGVIIHCEGGYLRILSNEAAAHTNDGKLVQTFKASNDHKLTHFTNFIQSVRDRNQAGLHADILEGHLSSSLCHLGNISYRLSHAEESGELTEKLTDEPILRDAVKRMVGHLSQNGVNLAFRPMNVGPWLKFDAARETFPQSTRANALLTRSYRHPFVVPKVTAS